MNGASATSDIEKIRVTGRHAPAKVAVVVTADGLGRRTRYLTFYFRAFGWARKPT